MNGAELRAAGALVAAVDAGEFDEARRALAALRSAWPRCEGCGAFAPTEELLERHRVQDCHGLRGWRRRRVTASEEQELAGLVGQAWELRGTAYLFDACQAITDWHDRRHVRWLERSQERAAVLVRLLRDTHPARLSP